MDLKQRKLTKSEWNSTEILVSPTEMDVLNLIREGYHNVGVRINRNVSIFGFLKIKRHEKSHVPDFKWDDYIYNKFLRKRVEVVANMIKSLKPDYKLMKVDSNIQLNSIDRMRMDRFNCNDIENKNLYEYVLLNHIEKFMKYIQLGNSKEYHYHYYTFYKLEKNNVFNVNVHIVRLVQDLICLFQDDIHKSVIIENAVDFIEKNENILKYGDLVLYEHQKEICTIIKQSKPKLIMYMAPTGTGKTLTPIALSEEKKIIFVCAARHVGLALARSAVSANKRIAFAFGCASAADIRLHYFSALKFKRNKRSNI